MTGIMTGIPSDAPDNTETAGCGGKGRSCGKDGSPKGDSGGKGNSCSCGEIDSRGIDGTLTSGTGSAGSHSALEGPRELDLDKVGESAVLPTSSSKIESGGEESA